MPTQRSLIHIVEDDPDFRASMVALLHSMGLLTAEYESAEAFLEDWDPQWPGCILLDLRLPGASGLEVLREIRSRGRRQPVFLITGHGSIQTAVRAMKYGADDVFTKPVQPEALLARVQEAVQKDLSHLDEYHEAAAIRERWAKLSPRERQVMEAIARGLSTKSIARELGVSLKTAEAHRTNMMHKMGAHSVAQTVRYHQIVHETEPVD